METQSFSRQFRFFQKLQKLATVARAKVTRRKVSLSGMAFASCLMGF